MFSSSIIECFNGVLKRMRTMSGLICPKILKKLNACIMESTKWVAISNGEVIFEVTLRPKRFVVHLHHHTCTCRLWDLTGVPCVHACAAINSVKGRPENYVHKYFTKEYFFRAYEYEIQPMESTDFSPKPGHELIQPPLLRRPPGRPKKQRHRSSLEGRDAHKAKRKHGMIKCSKCKQFGHNKRSCKENEQEIS
ncbi:unnamed protein product [Cuscuta epithymum]|uniref:SWIM-type domain-containing protein n=1 Tax=Cuscuta epithymum TaxID=186058 RepID=A0AAV0GCV0_9ASTE|nr:unnamed protein product [Cuscuta epithymum]